MEELREYFLGKELNEEETNEILQYFDDDDLDDFKIRRIYKSAEELGEYYLLELGEVDEYIAAVLDVSELGKHIVSVNTNYLMLANGRVVEFEW